MPTTDIETVRKYGRWTDDDRANVIALRMRTGANCTMIAHETGIPLPTVYRWITEASKDDNADPLIRHGWQSIVIRAQEKMSRYLDILDDANEATIVKEAQTLNIYAGTGSDKLLKAQQLEQPTNDNRTLVIVLGNQPPNPTTIDVDPQP